VTLRFAIAAATRRYWARDQPGERASRDRALRARTERTERTGGHGRARARVRTVIGVDGGEVVAEVKAVRSIIAIRLAPIFELERAEASTRRLRPLAVVCAQAPARLLLFLARPGLVSAERSIAEPEKCGAAGGGAKAQQGEPPRERIPYAVPVHAHVDDQNRLERAMELRTTGLDVLRALAPILVRLGLAHDEWVGVPFADGGAWHGGRWVGALRVACAGCRADKVPTRSASHDRKGGSGRALRPPRVAATRRSPGPLVGRGWLGGRYRVRPCPHRVQVL